MSRRIDTAATDDVVLACLWSMLPRGSVVTASVRDVERRTLIPRGSVSRSLKRLEEEGQIERLHSSLVSRNSANRYRLITGGRDASPLWSRRGLGATAGRIYSVLSMTDGLTATEVAACVEAAIAAHGRNVKVVSGRHCYEDFAYNSSTRAIIDMSGINQAGFDAEHDAYFVDAGCDNWPAYRTLLNAFGRTLTDGSCASVGAGGHISGGGYGLLSREHGLSVDWVTAVDIVTWDDITGTARLRHVS